MGQFIILPDGKLLMINGARNGTAGYTTDTPTIKNTADMPWGMSLAAEECLTPAIYDPEAPAGKRWSDEGLGASKIPRLYHSSAILLPGEYTSSVPIYACLMQILRRLCDCCWLEPER